MPTPAEVLLAQAQSQLARQESKLTAFRTIAGTVLATGGVVAGLLASRLSSDISATGKVFAALAVVTFALGTFLSLSLLAPRDGYRFSENLGSYVDWWNTHQAETDADAVFVTSLASNLDADRQDNEKLLAGAANTLEHACVLLGVQVLLWVIAALTS